MSADDGAVSLDREQRMLWLAECLMRLTPFVAAAGMVDELEVVQKGAVLLSGGVTTDYLAAAADIDQQIRLLMRREETESYRGVEYAVLDVLVLLGMGLKLGDDTDASAAGRLVSRLGEQARAIWETVDQFERRTNAETFRTVQIDGQIAEHALLGGIEGGQVVQAREIEPGHYEQREIEAQARSYQLLTRASVESARSDSNLFAVPDSGSDLGALVTRYRDADMR